MAARDRKDRGILILLVLLFLLLGGSLYAFFHMKNTAETHQAKIEELQVTLSQEKEKNRAALQELADKEEEIRDLEEYKKKAGNAREEYFRMAADLESRILSGESEAKIAYLTFDDGPYLTTTSSFLDVLDEYDVKATFFYLLKDERYDEIYRRVIDSGHTLANHTATHNLKSDGIYQSVETFLEDIRLNRDEIERRFGYRTDIMRFPGGSGQAREKKGDIIQGLREMGYGYVDWDTETGDGRNVGSVDEYIHGVLDHSENYRVMVVLMHDYSYNTAKALPSIIEGLRDQGFLFLPLFHESVKVK